MGFCQNVSKLLLSSDVINFHLPIPNASSNEMKSDINVLTSLMVDGILTGCNR